MSYTNRKDLMYNQGKYVVGSVNGIKEALCFSELMNHADVLNVFHGYPTSAGFFEVNNDGTICVWGESIGLKLKAEPASDSALIAKALGLATKEF